VAVVEFEATDEAFGLACQLDHVAIRMTFHYAIDTSKKSLTRLVIKAGQRENETTVEFVAFRPVLLPALPLLPTSRKHIQRLLRAVVLREVELLLVWCEDPKNFG